MLDDYDERRRLHGFDWGREGMDLFAHARYAPFPLLLRQVTQGPAERRTLSDALFELVATSSAPPTSDLLVATIGTAGFVVHRVPTLYALRLPSEASTSSRRAFGVLIRSELEESADLSIGTDAYVLAPGGALLAQASVDADSPSLRLGAGEHVTMVECGSLCDPATIELDSSATCRWSVTDDLGGAWFPPGALHKWDFHGRPWFHARTASLQVPRTELTVRATRGIEFDAASATVTPRAGDAARVTLEPRRRFAPRAEGWVSADLHVHLNYSGDSVARLVDAERAQFGEDLNLMNLVAGNLFTSLVYDREAFEHYLGSDLPWTTPDHVGRWGFEYRNDLLGHMHILNPGAAPRHYYTGHSRSDHPDDWPPNADACTDIRARGGTVGYTHPVSARLPDSCAPVFDGMPRSTEARELVADAALGLVDSIDLLGPQTHAGGSVALYHHLLNTGIRLAATVGTDTMLSLARCHTFSNPPGWARVYARVGGPITVEAWQDAQRRGRTIVTNGPWVTLSVDGRGPGDHIDVPAGTELEVSATCIGSEATRLRLIGPDGPVERVAVSGAEASIHCRLKVREPTWLAVEATGPPSSRVLGAEVYAHSTPVYIDVGGNRVGRRPDALWCLDWLDRLEKLLEREGHFSTTQRHQDVLDVIDRAREYYDSVAERGVGLR